MNIPSAKQENSHKINIVIYLNKYKLTVHSSKFDIHGLFLLSVIMHNFLQPVFAPETKKQRNSLQQNV